MLFRSGLSFPNYKKIAEAHKINYKKISNNKNLKSNLKKTLLGNKPIICELMLDHNQEQMPKAINKRTSEGKSVPIKYEDMYPFLSAKEINENMLYFPFNNDKSYTETTTESYEGGINFSRLDNPRLILKFTEPINNIKIYNVGSKIFEKIVVEGSVQIHVWESNLFRNGIRDYNNQPVSQMFSSADFYRVKKPAYKDPIIKLIDRKSTRLNSSH